MKQCAYCGNEISEKRIRRFAKYCTNECRHKHERTKYRKINRYPELRVSTIGVINELLVCVDLLKKNKELYKSVDPSSSLDYVILEDRKVKTLEIKTGYYTIKGKVYYPTLKKKPDILAVVTPDNAIHYIEKRKLRRQR